MNKGEACRYTGEDGKTHLGWFRMENRNTGKTLIRRMSDGGEEWVDTKKVKEGLKDD